MKCLLVLAHLKAARLYRNKHEAKCNLVIVRQLAAAL